MNNAVENLQAAQKRAMAIRPKVGGFPYLAESLRQAGVTQNLWYLPACESIYITDLGPVVIQGTPLLSGMSTIPAFNQDALIVALRRDQAGETTFPEFLQSTWEAGIVRYEVDFSQRTCTYFGVNGDKYLESYPSVIVEPA